MHKLYFLLFCLTLSFGLAAQLPSTEVYVFDYSMRDSTLRLSNALYLTAFNAGGYNNQPAWVDRNRLLLSVRTEQMEQPDIFSFDLDRRTKTRMTSTPAGEYSPKSIGSGDRFSAVRQEYVGQDTVLRLWDFPMNLQNNGKPVFKYINGIGYYEWLNSVQVALFLAQNPSSLVIANAESDGTVALATQVGRCFKRQPNGNLAYVDKSRLPWTIVEKNLYRTDDPVTVIAETLSGAEDFDILTDGSYLMGRGSQLYRFDPVRNPTWVQVADLRLYGIRNITRIAVTEAGRLALVNNASI